MATTWKSNAVKYGSIAADKLVAGVRYTMVGKFSYSDGAALSGDTIQMVPVPKGAKTLNVRLTGDSTNSITADTGDGGSTARWIATTTFSAAKSAEYWATNAAKPTKTYKQDDTIDLLLGGANLASGKYFEVQVDYVMEGVFKEDVTATSSRIP